MENRLIFAAVVIVGFLATSSALPARKRMIYFQQPAASQWYSAPQRLMYVQHVQPSATHARSTQATSALVAGETVAAGTYLEDCNHAESDVAAAGLDVQQGEDVLGAAGAHSSHSVAEAYPDDSSVAAPAPPPSRGLTIEADGETDGTIVADVPTPAEDVEQPEQTPIKSDDEAKVPRDYNFDANVPDSASGAAGSTGELPAPASIVPVSDSGVLPPARRYLPSNKKVYVELDHSAEASDFEQPDTENAIAVPDDEESQDGDEETYLAPALPAVAPKRPVSARRPVAKKPVKPAKVTPDCTGCAKAGQSGSSSKPQIPAGTFFPIDFGGTAGGAIAIANSFSTGEGGSATSHAIAYGSPDAVRTRGRPSKLH